MYLISECKYNIEAFSDKTMQEHTPGWGGFYKLMLQKWSERLAESTEAYIDQCGQSLPDTVEGNMWILNNPTLNPYRTVAALRWFCDDLDILTDDQLQELSNTEDTIGEKWHTNFVSLYHSITLAIHWREELNTCSECGQDRRYAGDPCHTDYLFF
jgi:hypothetical protein